MQDTIFLKAELASSKTVVILTHHKPDADALGSSLALGRFLEKKGSFGKCDNSLGLS